MSSGCGYCWGCGFYVCARLGLSAPPAKRQISSCLDMKTLLVLFTALVLQLVAAEFKFTEEWELWKKVRS